MYKIISKRFQDNIKDIKKLRKEFPEHQYINDAAGMIIKPTLDECEYGSEIVLENGDILFEPSEKNKEYLRNNLNKYEKHEEYSKIDIKTESGIVLRIWAASFEPKEIFFGNRKKNTEMFNKNTEYGKACYEMEMRSKSNPDTELRLDDPIVIKIVRLAIENSYKIPMDIFDSLGIIRTGLDIDKILSAALGLVITEIDKKKAATE